MDRVYRKPADTLPIRWRVGTTHYQLGKAFRDIAQRHKRCLGGGGKKVEPVACTPGSHSSLPTCPGTPNLPGAGDLEARYNLLSYLQLAFFVVPPPHP